MRRLIAKSLSLITRLKQKIAKQHCQLQEASRSISGAAENILNVTGDSGEASKLYEKAIELDETNSAALIGLACIYMNENNAHDATKLLDKAIRIRDSKSWEARILKGDILAQEGNLAGAALQYQHAAKKSKKNTLPIQRLIDLYENAGMNDVAEQWRLWLE